LITPKACVTSGTLINTSAVTTVTASPIAACRSDTILRFSLNTQAITSNATTPNADCNCSITPPRTRMRLWAGASRSAMLLRIRAFSSEVDYRFA
jgi:hypothetical protein